MSGFMLHGLGDCAPERHCGCLDIPAMTAPEPTPTDEHTDAVALDLDAIEARANAATEWNGPIGGPATDVARKDVPALVAEVRRLTESRATVAANLAASLLRAEAEVVTLRAKVTAVQALAEKRDVLYPPKWAFGAEENYCNGYRQARADFIAAMATGEGK